MRAVNRVRPLAAGVLGSVFMSFGHFKVEGVPSSYKNLNPVGSQQESGFVINITPAVDLSGNLSHGSLTVDMARLTQPAHLMRLALMLRSRSDIRELRFLGDMDVARDNFSALLRSIECMSNIKKVSFAVSSVEVRAPLVAKLKDLINRAPGRAVTFAITAPSTEEMRLTSKAVLLQSLSALTNIQAKSSFLGRCTDASIRSFITDAVVPVVDLEICVRDLADEIAPIGNAVSLRLTVPQGRGIELVDRVRDIVASSHDVRVINITDRNIGAVARFDSFINASGNPVIIIHNNCVYGAPAFLQALKEATNQVVQTRIMSYFSGAAPAAMPVIGPVVIPAAAPPVVVPAVTLSDEEPVQHKKQRPDPDHVPVEEDENHPSQGCDVALSTAGANLARTISSVTTNSAHSSQSSGAASAESSVAEVTRVLETPPPPAQIVQASTALAHGVAAIGGSRKRSLGVARLPANRFERLIGGSGLDRQHSI